MISTIVKHCAIYFCAFYVYTKTQNDSIKKLAFVKGALISLILGAVMCLLRLNFDNAYSMLIYAMFPLIYSLLYHVKIKVSIITSILSFGFSYAAFSLTCIVLAFILVPLKITPYTEQGELVLFLGMSIMQTALTMFSMKSKRIKKGLSYLIENGSGDIGVYISVIIFLTVGLLSSNKETHYIYVIPIILIAVCSLTLFFWRKNQITKLYIDQTKNQEIELLERAIGEKDKLIEALRADNDNLSQIIHKDNKLIPAMITAVKKYISENNDSEASDVLRQLESIYEGRRNAVRNYELTQKKPPSVGIASTDSIIFYMQQMAAEFDVNFDLCVSADVVKMTETVITKDDLNTLLADLIENAIISAKECPNKFVMVSISATNSVYSIAVYDSGENFDLEVLKNMGSKRITTHINDGGSGIGMMTTFQILNRYSAEFLIEEYSDSANFSKKVEISFNGTNQRRIITQRSKDLASGLKHTAFIVSDKS